MKKRVSDVSLFLLLVVFTVLEIHAQYDYGIHDPAGIVSENGRYYTFYTSNGVEHAYSTDLCTWKRGGRIFSSGFPSWINTYVPGFEGHFWAPQVFYMNNKWHVYYSCSTFGSCQSAIGLATSTSLENPVWKDEGMVVFTNNSSDHNAIDADVMRHDGKVWLIYGSFWSGIVMTRLDTTTGKPIDRNDLHYVADGNPEAAFSIYHGEHYYLFFNRGKCCDGVNSTYYINVGRSKNPAGPFLDKNNRSTSNGGGTVILETQGRFIGPGHFGYFAENGKEYMSYHYYDKNQNGMSKLKISTLSWHDGWPVVNTDFDPCNPGPVDDCAGVENGTAYIDECGDCVGGTTGKKPCKQDCNGDWGGVAFEDSCGVCAGGKTAVLPCAGSIQGEEALEFDGIIENTNAGYIGEGYLNLDNKIDACATWQLCADIPSHYTLYFRFANGGSENRNMFLVVNEQEPGSVIEIPQTGSWTNWKTVSAELELRKGKNRITLIPSSSEGAPNIDIITFSDEKLHRCESGIITKSKGKAKFTDMRCVEGVVSFHLEKEKPVTFRIYTASGRLVKKLSVKNVKKGMNHLDLNGVVSCTGIYLLFIYENGTDIGLRKMLNIR